MWAQAFCLYVYVTFHVSGHVVSLNNDNYLNITFITWYQVFIVCKPFVVIFFLYQQ